jgi:AmmeMemoRadiSam system protein A/AmmeMemoRadiSam system protein B
MKVKRYKKDTVGVLLRPIVYILVSAALALLAGCLGSASEQTSVGVEYGPGLGAQVEGYLAGVSVSRPGTGELMALVVPDAASGRSVEVTAAGFKAIEGLRFDTAVLVGQAHGGFAGGASVYIGDAFETPFGPLQVDEELARHLIDPASGVVFDPHTGPAEYASGLTMSFLRRALGEIKVLPVLIGRPGQKTYDRLMTVLANAATKRSRRVLLVALSDLSSDVPSDAAGKMDASDTQGLLRSGEASLTGGHAVLVVMEAARLAGADAAEVFAAGSSREAKEGQRGVTGHAALGYYDVPLSDAERVELLTLVRRAVEAAVRGEEFMPEQVEGPRLAAPGAAFVTIEKHRKLRGGVGQVQASGPLYRSAIRSARSAAMKDNRFPPVSVDELDELTYEVSVLSPLVPVLDTGDIELGVHGLYLKLAGHRGMLLPQVPVEQGWDLDGYLRQISLRAGLPPDAWKRRAARMWTFTTEIVR